MKADRSEVINFLSIRGMYHGDINFTEEADRFADEMAKGLAGQGSLQMLPTYLGMDDLRYSDEKVIVIDAGGTNFRAALASFNEKNAPVFEHYIACKMPGTDGREISVDEFFGLLADLVRPLIDKADRIGYCFSYPTSMQTNRDGRIIRLTKGLNVPDCAGALVGEGLLSALGYGTGEKRVSVLNDTVATLLGGAAAHRDREFASYCGLVLGTGYNMAYVESRANIVKDNEIAESGRQSGGSMIINIESGNYNRDKSGEIDRAFDAQSVDPGFQTFEKKISGAYLGGLVLETLRHAAEEGLYSSGFGAALSRALGGAAATAANSGIVTPDSVLAVPETGIALPDSSLIDEFLNHPKGENLFAGLCQNDRDRLLTFYFIDAILQRTAKLAAIGIAGVVKKTGAGHDPLTPVLFLAEGSTFYKSKLLKDRINAYVHSCVMGEMGLYCELLKADEATFAGSLVAGLM